MHSEGNGNITVINESWATKEELYLSSFTKEEQIQMAYDNLKRAWGIERKQRAENEARERGDRRVYWD